MTFHPVLCILPLVVQPSLFAAREWTVSTLTRYIRDRLETDVTLQDLWVLGEISNFKQAPSGHVYFTLKDAGAQMRSVMWKSIAARLLIGLENGMAVAVHGKVGVYEEGGQYQLYADIIRPAGEGALYQEFLRLKRLLEQEGLFDGERKRAIPERCRRVGIVTSATGAALHDMLDTLGRRQPMLEVVLAASPVQGVEAPPCLVSALAALNALKQPPDVILLARGGGSMEDLWAFNDERVVRAVAASNVPVICGVGHETDFTLADFAADLRAPTPTAAAELATSITAEDMQAELQVLGEQLTGSMQDLLGELRASLEGASVGLQFRSPARQIESGQQRLDELAHRLQTSAAHRLALRRSTLEGLEKRLVALSPVEVLARGYAVVRRRSDGAVVSKVKQARDGLLIQVSDGTFEAEAKRSGDG